MRPLSATVSKLFTKPLVPIAPVKAKLAVAFVVAPDSNASEQPSPSESKSKRLGMPSLSVSPSLQPANKPTQVLFDPAVL